MRRIVASFMVVSIFGSLACTAEPSEHEEESTLEGAALTARELRTGEQTVRGFYRDILEREPADAEVSHWEALIPTRGIAAIARDLLGSHEGRTVEVRRMYRTYLKRELDPGAAGWIAERALVSGDPRNVMRGILGSGEFFARNGNTTHGFVAALYRDVLGRSPSAPEVNAWLALAARSRTDVVNGFLASDELRSRIVHGWYQRYLRRPVDAPSLAFLTNAIRSGANWRDLQLAQLASAEYAARNKRVCVPTVTCLDALADCGTIDDGCGRALHCGTCEAPFVCGGGGVPNACGGGPIGPIGPGTDTLPELP